MATQVVTDELLDQLACMQRDLLQRVREGSLPAQGVLDALQRIIEGNLGTNIINCDADPFCPDYWTVEEHKKGGKIELAKTKIGLYRSKRERGGKYISGYRLLEELKDHTILNANALDHLLEYPELIPEEWKGELVFFWGTIYRERNGKRYVRYLYNSGGSWRWGGSEYDFGGDFSAAVLAS